MLPGRIHHIIYLLVTLLLVISLPVSNFMLSVSMILLVINWVLEGKLPDKIKKLRQQKSLLLLLSVYVIHILWLLNTSDLQNGLHDIRIKLPLLLMPLVLGTSNPFSSKEFKLILVVFVTSIFVSSLITSFVLFGFTKLDPVDSRYASLFISHIRFSLMVVLSIYILFYLLFFKKLPIALTEKYIYSFCLLWLISFLILLQSFTGIIIFILLIPLAIVWWSYITKSSLLIRISYALSLLLLSCSVAYLVYSYNRFSHKHEIRMENLESYTINGNRYDHYANECEYENGHRVWVYIAEEELKTEWNKVSILSYDSTDLKGQAIKYTLIRYMSSLGLRKDSVGISMLSPEDIHMIEKGYASYLYKKKLALYPRIYEILWGIERYRLTGDPSGQSISQRIEYLKVGKNIVKRFLWFGTGTGDVNIEFQKQYELDHSLLKPEWRHRAHNQLLTFQISFGIFGVLWIVFSFFAPVFINKRYKSFLLVLFFTICMLSMLNEDTLETHVGVTFFSFFFSFFLFASPENDPPDNEQT
jgi:hypothetical protein